MYAKEIWKKSFKHFEIHSSKNIVTGKTWRFCLKKTGLRKICILGKKNFYFKIQKPICLEVKPEVSIFEYPISNKKKI